MVCILAAILQMGFHDLLMSKNNVSSAEAKSPLQGMVYGNSWAVTPDNLARWELTAGPEGSVAQWAVIYC